MFIDEQCFKLDQFCFTDLDRVIPELKPDLDSGVAPGTASSRETTAQLLPLGLVQAGGVAQENCVIKWHSPLVSSYIHIVSSAYQKIPPTFCMFQWSYWDSPNTVTFNGKCSHKNKCSNSSEIQNLGLFVPVWIFQLQLIHPTVPSMTPVGLGVSLGLRIVWYLGRVFFFFRSFQPCEANKHEGCCQHHHCNSWFFSWFCIFDKRWFRWHAIAYTDLPVSSCLHPRSPQTNNYCLQKYSHAVHRIPMLGEESPILSKPCTSTDTPQKPTPPMCIRCASMQWLLFCHFCALNLHAPAPTQIWVT